MASLASKAKAATPPRAQFRNFFKVSESRMGRGMAIHGREWREGFNLDLAVDSAKPVGSRIIARVPYYQAIE